MLYTGLTICIAGSLLLIFRMHYYTGWINIAAMLCSIVPVLVWLDTFINHFTKSIDISLARKFIDKLVNIPVILGWFFCGYHLHIGYQHYVFSKNTEYVEARVEEEEISKHRGGFTKYFIYHYSYNNTRYCNEMKADGSGYTLGDVFELKVSTFDPTVTELTQ